MTRRARTIRDTIDQILATARLERVDWLESFLTHSGIKDAAGIAEAVDAALKLYNRRSETVDATFFVDPIRTEPGESLIDKVQSARSETIRTPKHVAIAGGDHEDCAAFAIALAMSLGLPYELSVRKDVLWLHIVTTQILPRPVK
jgi:hypothetical protein